jgi:hypothetical protein
LHQPLEEFHWQPRTGLAVRLAGHVEAGHMRHVIARRVARQDLPQKRMHGGGGIQSRLPPHITQFATDLLDTLPRQNLRHFALDLFQHGPDKWRHPWPPGKMGLATTTFSQEAGIF